MALKHYFQAADTLPGIHDAADPLLQLVHIQVACVLERGRLEFGIENFRLEGHNGTRTNIEYVRELLLLANRESVLVIIITYHTNQ